ncbi:filamentous hemagglutinin N-terminal domain-containing protein, partial [Thermodesulfobacteriota bacterium]
MTKYIFRKKGISFFLIFMIYSFVFPWNIFALPQGGQVVSGNVNISRPDVNNMNINQGTNKAIINWQGFSIAQPEAVRFFQPGSSSVALNRVIGVDPSLIYGRLSANGRIFLINPNGVMVGPTGKINVNSFLASTLDMANSDFLSGNYTFSKNLSSALSSIVNKGSIEAAEGGFVSLLAPSVQNHGSIMASLGKVYIGSGEKVTLNFADNELIGFAVDESVLSDVLGPDGEPLDSSISNSGTISADGGEVILSAKTAYDAIKSVINNEGIIEAKSIGTRNGRIVLNGGDQGIVENSGILNASGRGEGETGGSVDVLGDKVGLFETASIDVTGALGGGNVRIGGDFQGKNPDIQNASRTYVGPDASITADALTLGDGGTVIIWADDATTFAGNIAARGGAMGGDGGFAEVSGKHSLGFSGLADLRAPVGERGMLLLDPDQIIIGTTDGGVDPQTIANTTLVGNLDGANVTLLAAVDISVNSAVNASGNPSAGDLSLEAPTINLDALISLYAGSTLSGTATTVNVQSNSASIQNGIDVAAADATVNVLAGSYTEDPNIDKSLTLQGADASTVTLNGGITITEDDIIVDKFTIAPTGYGVIIDSSAGIINNTTITNNIFSMPTGPRVGVWVGGATPSNAVTNTVISNNTFNGPATLNANPFKVGGQFGSPLNATVDGLEFHNNTVDQASININLQNGNLAGISVQNNEFTNTDGVLYVWAENGSLPSGVLSDFTFENNLVDSSNAYGIGIDLNDDFTDANFGTGNRITNNSFDLDDVAQKYGIDTVTLFSTNLTNYVLDASGNWYGTNDAAGVAPEVSVNVDYTPWLSAGTDTDGATGFQGDFSVLYVDDDSPQTGGTGRINEAIGLVTASTVNVEAGTYDENINANVEGLNIIGAGATTIIDPTLGDGITIGADNVTIQDLRVTDAETGITGTGGMGIETATISNVQLDANTTGLYASTLATLYLSDLTLTSNTTGGTITNVATVDFTTSTTGSAADTVTVTSGGLTHTGNDAIGFAGTIGHVK